MTEMQAAMALLGGKLSTAILRIDYPVHNGKPNLAHGKFYLVGHIPADCYDWTRHGSKLYDTEQDAIVAAKAAGATRIQRCDCSFA
jgi:hypothetical protein